MVGQWNQTGWPVDGIAPAVGGRGEFIPGKQLFLTSALLVKFFIISFASCSVSRKDRDRIRKCLMCVV